MITDTHSHVFYDQFDADREAMLARARAAGVSRVVVVGTDAASSRRAFELAALHPGLYPTAGIHPHDCEERFATDRDAIAELARDPRCVAVGETGLDFFRSLSAHDVQIECLRFHLALAREVAKPVIVHCRDAHPRMVDVLREARGVIGVMHCWSMGAEELEPYLELGYYISFSGVVTYPKNDANRAAARAVPLDRVLVETDCPYLAPKSRRGKRNEPAFVCETLETVARERGVSTEELARATSDNAARLFRLA
ncbi:MAG: TatD family hydrolase [Planctomycetes bacterium]|nr:TatD family hydrolase [Planctomycetota bacterium]